MHGKLFCYCRWHKACAFEALIFSLLARQKIRVLRIFWHRVICTRSLVRFGRDLYCRKSPKKAKTFFEHSSLVFQNTEWLNSWTIDIELVILYDVLPLSSSLSHKSLYWYWRLDKAKILMLLCNTNRVGDSDTYLDPNDIWNGYPAQLQISLPV